MKSYQQKINKALTFTFNTPAKRQRVLAPYDGNLTKKKEAAIYEKMREYINAHNIGGALCVWRSEDIVITWPEDKSGQADLKEKGASCGIGAADLFVCYTGLTAAG